MMNMHMIITDGMYFSFCIFMNCPELPFHKSSLGSFLLITTMVVMMAATSVELPAGLGQHDVVQLGPPIVRDKIRSVVGLITVPQQQLQSQVPS